MTNRAEVIAEIDRLDKERTQGIWRMNPPEFPDFALSVLSEITYATYREICEQAQDEQSKKALSQSHANFNFIALAPQMAALIREQEKRIEVMGLALNHAYSFIQAAIGKDGKSFTLDTVNEALALIESDEPEDYYGEV